MGDELKYALYGLGFGTYRVLGNSGLGFRISGFIGLDGVVGTIHLIYSGTPQERKIGVDCSTPPICLGRVPSAHFSAMVPACSFPTSPHAALDLDPQDPKAPEVEESLTRKLEVYASPNPPNSKPRESRS